LQNGRKSQTSPGLKQVKKGESGDRSPIRIGEMKKPLNSIKKQHYWIGAAPV
jgi:hypothetical protein